MKKRIIIAILIVAILIIGIGFVCYYNIPRLSYEYSNEYEGYIVAKAYGNSESYNIPSTYKNKKVVGIGTRAFMGHDELEKIIFDEPSNIIVIEKLAFSECEELKYIDLEYVQYIERNAFSYCYKLNNLKVGALHIGASAFFKCESLDNFELVGDLISIGSMAISYTAIREIKLPRSTEIVYDDCFLYAFSLRNIVVYGNNLLENEYLRTLKMVTYVG